MPNKTWTAEEILSEGHFKKHTARYIVRLRREGQGHLGELYEQARRRFHQLERRFQEHPDLHQAYSEFMQEYEELGHMNQINEDTSNPADLISRGTNPETLKNCRLWWIGPEWLSQHQEQWPNTPLLRHPELPPEQREAATVKVMIQCSPA